MRPIVSLGGVTRLAALWFCSLFILQEAYGSTIVSGELTMSAADGQLREPERMYAHQRFQVLINGPTSWRIELTDPAVPFLVTYLAYNGSSLLYYRTASGHPDPRLPGANDPKRLAARATNDVAYLNLGPVPLCPFFPGDGRETLWFAFFAGSSLTRTELLCLPDVWLTPRSDLGAYGFTNDIRLTRPRPDLILSATFVRTARADLSLEGELSRPTFDEPRTPAEMDRARSILRFRKNSWKDGDIAASYDLTQYTNVAGRFIPISFQLTFKRMPALRLPGVTHAGKVDRVIPNVAEQDPFPAVTGLTHVADSRFRSRTRTDFLPEVVYVLKPGQAWRGITDPVLKDMAVKDLPYSPRLGFGRIRVVRGLFLAIIAIVTLGLPLLLSRRQHEGSG